MVNPHQPVIDLSGRLAELEPLICNVVAVQGCERLSSCGCDVCRLANGVLGTKNATLPVRVFYGLTEEEAKQSYLAAMRQSGKKVRRIRAEIVEVDGCSV